MEDKAKVENHEWSERAQKHADNLDAEIKGLVAKREAESQRRQG